MAVINSNVDIQPTAALTHLHSYVLLKELNNVVQKTSVTKYQHRFYPARIRHTLKGDDINSCDSLVGIHRNKLVVVAENGVMN